MTWDAIAELRGPTGPAGTPGRDVEMRVDAGVLQYRLAGGTWGDLVVLTSLLTPVQFTQDVPSDTWVIPHTFIYNPSVTLLDTDGDEVEAEIVHTPGVVTVRADIPFSGRAVLV